MISRRDFLLTSGAVALGASAWGQALARAPMAEAQVPGFYRFNLGQFQVTVVSDGDITLPVERLITAAPAEREPVLSQTFQALDKLKLQLNTLVVNTGERLVLIDAGSRGKMQPSTGRLLDNLQQAGINPGDIDTVVITHAHPDHLWGVTGRDNQPTFPNAEYVFGETELNFWSQPNNPLANTGWAATLAENMKTIPVIKERIRTLKDGQDVVTGIQVVALPGHTPGQIGVQIASGSQILVTTADAVGNRIISFEYPDWGVGFDLDVDQGIRTRRGLLDRTAADKILVSSYHLPFPGIGHVMRKGTAYQWLPVDYQWQITKPA